MKKFLKKSDKGFSLVELIVVIAIMAVLIGVIAPAFMKYVGKSKDSVKTQNLDEMRRAANIVIVDETFTAPAAELSFTITDGVYSNETDAAAKSFKTLMDAALGAAGYPEGTYTVTIAANGESVKVQ